MIDPATLRICTKCATEKPASEFYKSTEMRSGRRTECKACSKAGVYAWRAKHPERWKSSMDSANALREYGISLAEAQALRTRACDICGKPGPSFIDHDHATGKVRGSLCHLCNIAIGALSDSPARLASAIRYLETRNG